MFYCEECREKNNWPKSTHLLLDVVSCQKCGEVRECWDVLLSIQDEADVLTPAGRWEQEITKLKAALMVLDVTLFCLVVSGEVDELFMGQVRAAAEAYKHATGEPSMLVENRCHKDFTKEAASAEGK